MSKRNKKTLGKLLLYIRPYWIRMSIAFIALVISSGLFLLIGKGLGQLTDLITLNNPSEANLTKELNRLIIYAVPILVGYALGLFIRNYFMKWIGERASINIRNDVFRNVVYLTPSFYDKHSYGQIQTRITADARELQGVIGNAVPGFLHHFLMMLGGVVFAIYLSPWLSLLVAACIPVIFFPSVLLSGVIKRLSSNKQSVLAKSGNFVGEILRNLKLVQANRYQDTGSEKYASVLENLFSVSVKSVRVESFLNSFTSLLAFGTLVAVLWYGGNEVFSGAISPGDLVMFIFFSNIVTNSAAQLVSVSASMSAAIGAAERLLELRDETSRLNLVALPLSTTEVTGGNLNKEEVKPWEGKIEIKNLSFSYPSRKDKLVLKDINVLIESNQTVSIVGTSGSGKSTLFDLLQKFYLPRTGHIYIDGRDLSSIQMDYLMTFVAIVPQQPELFSGSVLENLRVGNQTATEEDVWFSLEQAQAADFVRELPEGIHTDLGQEGVRLSGGQKQRLSIARAIIKQPKILLLDEPTSALDAESEALIQKAFDASRINRTTLIITHRLSTAIKSDQIIMMLGGRLIDMGTHEVLMKRCPEYAGLVRLSFEGSFLPADKNSSNLKKQTVPDGTAVV